ncbi:MAG: PD-(D/E)XK nuclease domain-containing protein, partial [Candidatus Omnitrophota bacterium]
RGSDDEGNTLLSIPNETVKHLYYDFIKATYEETGGLALNTDAYLERMQEMAFRGNWEALVNYIAKDMESSLGLRDLITGEKAIQVFWNVYLGLSKYYIIHTEKEMNQGYADILMEPLLNQYPNIKFSYVLEIKYMKPLAKKKEIPKEKIEKLKQDAGAQLDRYGNDERFLKVIGQTALKKIILIFSGHRLIYHGEV